MKTKNIFTSMLLISLAAGSILFAQEINNNTTPLDINSKAKELGILPEQLQDILNSVSEKHNEGGGDPLPEAIQERFFTGQAAGDYFGYSVSSAGDVNGDGYDDIIVGAPLSNAGRAYIFFGGATINNMADVILTGFTTGDNFGLSVSTAGDVNGDGYSDVIVGSQYDNAGGTFAGRAYIYFGGAVMDNIADVILNGEAFFDFFGISVSSAGDVNGDGYSDVIVGAAGNDAGGEDAGRAYIYFGGAAMDNTPDVILTGEAAFDLFGYSVSSAGDVNGDGYSDIIVGAFLHDAGGTDAGRAYIYFGGAVMDNTADLILTGEAADDLFGYSVSSAGDVNGDGYSDVIVGAPLNDAGGFDAGRAYIYFGGPGMNNTADVILTGDAGDQFGRSVSSAGDVNGDGYSDVIVGAPLNDAGGFDAGRAYIYFGGAVMDNTADVILTGEAAGDRFGRSVSSAGDVNGDGYSDVIVGAYLNDAGGNDAGRAYLYLNSLTGYDIPDEFFTGAAAEDRFGRSVSSAGDVNGDGYDDIIVGAYQNDAGGTDAGRAYIYFGGPGMNNTADVILTGEAAGDWFGNSVSSAGDVNGDGYDDIIVGAYLNDAGGTDAGRAYIYFGGAVMDNTADLILTGEAADDLFGYSVSSAGDVNGDGYSDVIVGARRNDAGGTDAGRAYIYFGGPGMNNTADVILTGADEFDLFGYSVSSAGDVNGDGYSDVIVGAYRNDAGGTNAGRAYIYFGGAVMDNEADVILTGEAAGDQFGRSVSSAGDVNGDGYDDIIVGTEFNDAGGFFAGRAYIYFGGAVMDNTADVILTGEASGNFFGGSVSSAGDVNGDGYDDIIIGALTNSAGGTFAGRAYIYFGGPGMNNTADLILTGEASGDEFGNAVSGAGDVNGDGYSDVIVGAYLNDAGGSNAGRAYLYLSSSPPIKPRIMNVKDVPYDQGGYVFVNFVRSGYDARGQSNIITEYLIEMSNPPGINGFSWIQIGSVQPVQNPLYTFIAETPNDSMTNNSGTYYFRVTARTSDPNQYWRSNIMYGHSVDNLAPAAPLAFYASLNGEEVNLGWQANTEPDLRDYYIYRSDSQIGEDLTLIGTTTDTTFTDTAAVTGTVFYFVQAYDIHDNGSPFSSDSVMAFLSANIRVFLEGAYAGGQMTTTLRDNDYIPLSQPYNTSPWVYNGTETVTNVPEGVVDWVLLELRSDTTTHAVIRAAFLMSDGSLAELDGESLVEFPGLPEGEYYLVIYHRNHLPIMTANPVELSVSPSLYDLTAGATQAYGSDPMKDLGGGTFGMYSGDTNNSGIITAADKSLVNSFNLSAGYYNADTNFSGIVTAADKSNINSNNLKQEFVP